MLIGALFITHSTAASNKEDIATVIQAQKFDHDGIVRQMTETIYIKEDVTELKEDFDAYRNEQRTANTLILNQLNKISTQ